MWKIDKSILVEMDWPESQVAWEMNISFLNKWIREFYDTNLSKNENMVKDVVRKERRRVNREYSSGLIFSNIWIISLVILALNFLHILFNFNILFTLVIVPYAILRIKLGIYNMGEARDILEMNQDDFDWFNHKLIEELNYFGYRKLFNKTTHLLCGEILGFVFLFTSFIDYSFGIPLFFIIACFGFELLIYKRIPPPLVLFDKNGMKVRTFRKKCRIIQWSEIRRINIEEKETASSDGISIKNVEFKIIMNNQTVPQVFTFSLNPDLEFIEVLREILLFLCDKFS